MITVKSCKGCTERHTACWGTCERYKAEKAAAVEASRRRTAARVQDRTISSVQYTGLRKVRKRK